MPIGDSKGAFYQNEFELHASPWMPQDANTDADADRMETKPPETKDDNVGILEGDWNTSPPIDTIVHTIGDKAADGYIKGSDTPVADDFHFMQNINPDWYKGMSQGDVEDRRLGPNPNHFQNDGPVDQKLSDQYDSIVGGLANPPLNPMSLGMGATDSLILDFNLKGQYPPTIGDFIDKLDDK